ncbi:hypothetical protein [Pseudokineococcus lusitanus]|uniref:Glycosyl hydrolase family 32 n=1 Tax=Pseudokineococcus lusitanus TaxID=763993 RepID=A0A3N1G8A5_9ACTN|nr:hypothetical protein [Pseudokineococcus lusitanus]ROP26500.1 hypothetical protein EDC03_3462 [Pseudokineococcus lusitanus]
MTASPAPHQPVVEPPAGAAPLTGDAWWEGSVVVLEPADPRPGAWAGGPSVVLHDGTWWLAVRLRRPLGEGRGYANVVLRSEDGVTFTPVAEVLRTAFGAESLERPALVRTPEGRWRLYVSCATPGTKHWRVDLLEADDPAGLATAPATTVLPGSDRLAVKDPVVRLVDGRWHLWASVHPLEDPDATDRMTTEHATSDDGVAWTWHGTALAGRPGEWDARGVRVATVLDVDGAPWALYDGRATADENWEERTGLAVGVGDGRFAAVPGGPFLAGPHGAGGLRYVDVADVGDGTRRWFFEVARPDGAHELRTVVLPGGSQAA